MELPSMTTPIPDARPDRDEDEVRDPFADAVCLLAQRREVDVVLDRQRGAEPLAERVEHAGPLHPERFAARRIPPLRSSTTPGLPMTVYVTSSSPKPASAASGGYDAPDLRDELLRVT